MIKTILRSSALLLLAAPAVAQTSTFDEARLRVAINDGDFSLQPPRSLEPWNSLRFRLSGKNTEWTRLVVDCDITNDLTGKYPWLQPKSTTNLASIGDSTGSYWIYSGAPSIPDMIRGRLEHELHLGVREYGSMTWSSASVSDWFVPFYIGRKSRTWSSTAYWWEADKSGSGGQGLGPNNAAWWNSLNQYHYDGTAQNLTKFSVDAIFRRYVLFRAAVTADEHNRNPFVVANEFFNDAAMFTGHTAIEHFRIHVYGVMLQDPDAVASDDDEGAPRFDEIPYGRITNGILMPIILPKFSTIILGPEDLPGLAGTLTAGTDQYFEGAGLIPPVRVSFPTTTGPEIVDATASMTRDQPLRMKVAVPSNVIQGDLSVQVQNSKWFFAGRADLILEDGN